MKIPVFWDVALGVVSDDSKECSAFFFKVRQVNG
jgi:hypothetical protein